MAAHPEYPPVEEGHRSEERDIPQLLETGISADYRNAFLSYEAFARKYGPVLFDRLPEPHRIKRYAEWFPAETYGNVVTDDNRETVAELDGIVDELNTMLESPTTFETQRFIDLCEQADALILGRTEQRAA